MATARPQPPSCICTLVYAFHGSSLVLLRRRRQPNLGLWSPPGGHVRVGETPHAAARRELREETGLAAGAASLRLVVSELDVTTRRQWLLFGFVCRLSAPETGAGAARPALVGGPEGEPAWIELDDVQRLPRPPADDRLLAAVLASRPGVAFARVRFDGERLLGVRVSWA